MEKRKWLFAALLGGLLALWLVFEPGCMIRSLTGIPCPGCGMSRAWLSALKLDFAAAFRCHPLFWTVPVVGWLMWKEFRPFHKLWINIALTAALTLALLGCWLWRLNGGHFYVL